MSSYPRLPRVSRRACTQRPAAPSRPLTVIPALAAEPAPSSNRGISTRTAPSPPPIHAPKIHRPRLDLGPKPNTLRSASVRPPTGNQRKARTGPSSPPSPPTPPPYPGLPLSVTAALTSVIPALAAGISTPLHPTPCHAYPPPLRPLPRHARAPFRHSYPFPRHSRHPPFLVIPAPERESAAYGLRRPCLPPSRSAARTALSVNAGEIPARGRE